MSAVRAAATVVMWIVTTILLTAAIPVIWAQEHVVSRSGYAELAQRAAADPALQSAMATELAAQVSRLGTGVNSAVVNGIARTYTESSSFPGQFGQANAFAHRWLFTNTVASGVDEQGRWVINIAPMLADVAFTQTLRDYNISVPSSVPIPLTDNAPVALRPGALSGYGEWAPWVSGGLAALTVGSATVMLVSARRRGNALAALGLSALLAVGALWVAAGYARGYAQREAEGLPGPMGIVADVMAATAVQSILQWLAVTVGVGAALIAIGVIGRLLGGLR